MNEVVFPDLGNKEIADQSFYLVFKEINFDRPLGHSANKICWDRGGEQIIAIRCNCDKRTYHPIINGKVFWDLSVKKKNGISLEKGIHQALLIAEE